MTDNFAPIAFETDIASLPIAGELPKDLRGALFRNGPNPQFEGGADAHWFTGDGMIHAFHIENGRIAYRNRWVKTDRWQAEHLAGHALFGGFSEGPKRVGNLLDGGVANTNIVWHGGRLLALEEAHLPTELDPRTLATTGVYRNGGLLRMPFTAHPKIDPETGEMIFFGYSATGPLSPVVAWGTLDASGAVTRTETFEAPYCSMIHDFIVTREHVVLPVLPLTGDLARARRGGPAFAWEPEKGATLAIMRRDRGVSSLVWVEIPPCYVFHVMNAWDENGCVVADLVQYNDAPLFPDADGTVRPKPLGRLVRWTIDPRGGTGAFKSTVVEDLAGEFPRYDERWFSRGNRHGYLAAHHPGTTNVARTFDTIAHLDLADGRRDLFVLPDGDATSEPVFVPLGDEEGEGVLLAVVWRAREARSDLLVFDAANVAAGPLASAHLPHRVPFGFHGNWQPTA